MLCLETCQCVLASTCGEKAEHKGHTSHPPMLQCWRMARTTEEHGDVQGDGLRGPKPLSPLGKSGSRTRTSSHRISRAGAGVAPASQQCLCADTRQGAWAHSCSSTQAAFILQRVAFHSSCFFLPSAEPNLPALLQEAL